MTTPAGQSAVGITKIKPAAEVIYSLVEQTLERMAGEPVAWRRPDREAQRHDDDREAVIA